MTAEGGMTAEERLPRHRDPGSEVVLARERRRAMTAAERQLWQVLRAHRFHGLGFRRQHPVGPFIAPFACPALRLVIELDPACPVASEPVPTTNPDRAAGFAALGWTLVRVASPDLRHIPGPLRAHLDGRT